MIKTSLEFQKLTFYVEMWLVLTHLAAIVLFFLKMFGKITSCHFFQWI